MIDDRNTDAWRTAMGLELIYPTRWARSRRVAEWVRLRAWMIGETGPFGWVGDRADQLEHRMRSSAATRRPLPSRRSSS